MPAKQQNKGNICQICLKFKSGPRGPFCNGHSKSGGGSSGGGAADASSNDNALSQSGVSPSDLSGVKGQSQTLVPHSEKPSNENDKPLTHHFDEDIISYLLNNKLLTIKNDRESGMLTITCLSHLLSDKQKDELNKFTNLCLSIFEQFKKDNKIDGVSPEIKRNEKGQITKIVITLPSLELYDKFIQALVKNNLLPKQMANQAINQPSKNLVEHSPFSSKPVPGTNKKHDHEGHGVTDKKRHGKLNPFDIHRGPKFRGE